MKKITEIELREKILSIINESTYAKVGVEYGLSPGLLNDIVKGHRAITGETAKKFGFVRFEQIWFEKEGSK